MLANAEVKVTSSMVPKTATALLQDIELMPQYQDFGFQPPPRLGAVAARR